jgi:glycosyltransferase involved in cell wall biosynthesis
MLRRFGRESLTSLKAYVLFIDAMRITYLYRLGRKSRLANPDNGPTEFFYGYHQLQTQGLDVHLLEDADIGMAPPLPSFARFFSKLSVFLYGVPIGMVASLLVGGHYRKLANAGCLVVTTNGMGMALAIARAFGFIRPPVLLIAMGLLPHKSRFLQTKLYGFLIRHISIACISKGETEFLSKKFRCQNITYFPFGVDHRFWLPSADRKDSNYVLAIGNDLARDWKTLVEAWRIDFPRLKIVTNLPVPTHGSNIEVIYGDWRTQALSDEDIRRLYQGARFVVIPLHDTIQPAGQSACLQAMACGRPVIMSNIMGLWDRDLMQDGENVVLVTPRDVAALSQAVTNLLLDPKLCMNIGANARVTVVNDFNVDAMASALRPIIVETINSFNLPSIKTYKEI